ncbi:hypothetical protein PLICRDRAFT_357180 [Plicaturopsis crispa FD-325 SS-3]|uniref:Major facilitator superfamily (MFS) profile domain-containing protein n=1 Tax=Plicaturopsis crispa FD-325 SS-3 TaxID=944288 RepID=A0A0C9SXX6_PLICR|nr:hypothetical protein PLICRDRAFT_357180 [Plicaturopsis crispa FD-325 SS-3]
MSRKLTIHEKPFSVAVDDSSVTLADPNVDLYSYHEKQAGRLVVDPGEAMIELGPALASKLKLTEDGTKVLWPQPTDSADDPQNWSSRRKALQLFVITLTSIVPDFVSGTGIASIFALAKEFDTTTGVINNLTSNWSIFLIGWGGLFAIILMRRYGRLPILFWSQALALAFLIAQTLAPNLKTFAAMRCLTGFFGTCPQVTGLYVVTDIFPFHLQAKKLNIWTTGFIFSPFLSPFVFGFLVARASWRWAYGTAAIYNFVVLVLIVLFLEETMYDRTLKPLPPPRPRGLRYRLETLIGVTGARMAKYRSSWKEVCFASPKVFFKPHVFAILLYQAPLFGFAIGVNTTNAVLLGTPPPVGFGFSTDVVSGLYATPVVAVMLGALLQSFLNEWIMNLSIRRNNGVFEAENRLWACYIAVPLYVCGFLLLGAALEKRLGTVAIILGWGIAQIAITINAVAAYAYCNDCFPKNKGEVSALVNLTRTMGGFAVAYFQVPWTTKSGAMQTFGIEAAIVAAMFLLIVPVVQLKGRYLRKYYSMD